MILTDKTNYSPPTDDQMSRQRTPQRFRKYKSILESHQFSSQQLQNQYQSIFATLTYTSIIDKNINNRCSDAGKKSQKKEGDYCENKWQYESEDHQLLEFSVSEDQDDFREKLNQSNIGFVHQKIECIEQNYLTMSTKVQKQQNNYNTQNTDNNTDKFQTNQLIFSLSQPFFEINHKKPTYIRQFDLKNSVIPNPHHPAFNIKLQMKNLISLIKSALTAIHFVFDCALRMKNKTKQIKVFSTNNYCKFTLNYFVNSGWEVVKIDQKLLKLKPYDNFIVQRPFQKVLQDLDQLLSKTTRYQLAVSLTQCISFELYLNIRQNLLQIQEKLLVCSNAIYALSLKHEYPQFYYTYLQILRNPKQSFGREQLQNIETLFRKLWQIKEPITCSEIGRHVWEKINF